jgi:hypothetical protein
MRFEDVARADSLFLAFRDGRDVEIQDNEKKK